MRKLRPYVVSALITAIATLVRMGVTPLVGLEFPFLAYWPSVEIIAYFYGFRPALFAIGMSLVCARYFFMLPPSPFLFPQPREVVSASLFALFTASLAMFMENLRVARAEAEANASLAEQRLGELQAEAEARRRERYWAESILAGIGDGVIAADGAGAVTYMNEVAEKLTGWGRSEASGQPVERVFYTIEEAPYHVLYATDGRTVPIEHTVSAIRDSRDQALGTVVVFRDVTKRKSAKEALEASETRLHAGLRAAGAAAWEWNLSSNEVIRSAEFRDLTGAAGTAEYLDFAEWMDSVHHDDRVHLQAELNSAIQRGCEFRLEYRAFRNEEVRWIALLGSLAGQSRIVGIAVDITDRRHMEEKLRNAAKQESLGVLSGGIAHDFNNLLTTILGYASLLRSELEPDSAPSEYARNIELAGERAAHLTRQILAYAGQGRFSFERIDLAQHVRQALSELRSCVGAHTQVELHLETGLPQVEADPRQADQVITNILMNSFEAIDNDKGCVKISVFPQSVGDDDFPGQDVPPTNYVVLEVRDSGPGMDEATKARIFDPFFTTKFTGRGLGLAAVSGIARGHGAAVRVESEPGKGTLFQVFWPAVESSGTK